MQARLIVPAEPGVKIGVPPAERAVRSLAGRHTLKPLLKERRLHARPTPDGASFKLGTDSFLTVPEAVNGFENRRSKELKSLQRQIAKLEKLESKLDDDTKGNP